MTDTRPPGAPVLPGSLDVLILQALRLESRHGLGIARRVEQITRGTFAVKAGSLFPALYRLERAGLVTSQAGESENHRHARFYTLTPAGRRHLRREKATWRRIVDALAHALGPAS
jgi:PadR family transcriptional regulator PadR